MILNPAVDPINSPSGHYDWIADEPEQPVLLRMMKLVEHLYRVPVAYVALLQSDLKVVTRIGSGREHWQSLKKLPLPAALAQPRVWPSVLDSPDGGNDLGDLRFVATAPLRSSDGLDLGVLVIADTAPKPEFSQKDRETLAELAGVVAGKMEFRLMACQVRESESSLREAENRFRHIADHAPLMIMYSGVDSGCLFVNKTWLDFTGRSLEEELGDGYADAFHPEHRERVMQAYWEAFRDRRPFTAELPMQRYDGEYRWVQASGAPRLLDGGDSAGYIGCFTDLTDRRDAFSESGGDAGRSKPGKPA